MPYMEFPFAHSRQSAAFHRGTFPFRICSFQASVLCRQDSHYILRKSCRNLQNSTRFSEFFKDTLKNPQKFQRYSKETWYRLLRYSGTDWSDILVPIRVLRMAQRLRNYHFSNVIKTNSQVFLHISFPTQIDCTHTYYLCNIKLRNQGIVPR